MEGKQEFRTARHASFVKFLLVGACWCTLGGTVFGRQANVRVSALVQRAGEFDPDLTDMLLVELSTRPALEALERERIELLFAEWERRGFVDDRSSQVRLGTLFAVDLFVFLAPGETEASVLEIVAARTGLVAARLFLEERADDPRALVARAVREVETAAAEVRARADAPPPSARDTLAFAEVFISGTTGTTGAGREQQLGDVAALLGGVQELLVAQDVPLLNRSQVDELVRERWWNEGGLGQRWSGSTQLLGARFLLSVRLEPDRVFVSLLDTARGVRVGQEDFALTAGGTATCAGEMAAWIQRQVALGRQRTPPARPAPSASGDSLQPETLTPFYAGVRLYDSGRYLEATDRFREALQRDARFREPYVWLQHAFSAAGFDEIAAAVVTYLHERRQPWVGLGTPKLVHSEPGTSFLGLTVDDPSLAALQHSLSFLVVDALHEATGQVVFLSEDLAALRTEYDVLVGLSGVEGTTWKSAPALVFERIASAHLRRAGQDGERHVLEVRYTDRLHPGRQSMHALELPRSTAGWPRAIETGLAAPRTPVRADDLPPAGCAETLVDVLARLEHAYTDADFLHLVAHDPERLEYLGGWRSTRRSDLWHSLDFGLKRWLLRVLPAGAPARPWHELAFLTEFHAPGNDRLYPGISHGELQHDYAGGLRAVIARFPEHEVASIARFNLAVHELRAENHAETRATLARLREELEGRGGDVASKLLRVLDGWSAIFAVAAGEPVPPNTEILFTRGVGVHWSNTGESKIYGPGRNAGLKIDDPGRLRREVELRLRLFPERIAFEGFEPRHLVELAREHGEVELVEEAVREFLASMNTVHWEERDRWLEEDLLSLYEYLTERTLVLLGADAPPRKIDGLVRSVHAVSYPSVLFEWMDGSERLQDCRARLRERTLAALDVWRAQGFSAAGVRRFLNALDGWPRRDAPDVEAVFLQLAADSWERGSPRGWLDFVRWKRGRASATEIARLQANEVERLRSLRPERPRNVDDLKVYSQFALDLFRGGEDRVAQTLYQEQLAWDVADPYGDVPLYRANALLILAMIHKRAGDVPRALELAQAAVDASGDQELGLLYATYGSRGWRQNLKPYAVRLIDTLRNDPEAPVEDPFENFRPDRRAATAHESAAVPRPADVPATGASPRGWARGGWILLGCLLVAGIRLRARAHG